MRDLTLRADAFSSYAQSVILDFYPKGFDLIICDPGYGEVTKEKWDVAQYMRWMNLCEFHAKDVATIAMWGGVGQPGHRPFFEFASLVEKNFPSWEAEHIVWAKKRAYGVKNRYLFTREELMILRRGEPVFNIPLLDEKRGYAGYNKKYPAKSDFYRRKNVWTDVTEILGGKIHPTQKPDRLYEILVETHTNPGMSVLDPCAGSLTTRRVCQKLGRHFCVIEENREYIKLAAKYPTGLRPFR